MLSTEPFELPAALIAQAQTNDPVAMAVVGADHPVALDSAKQATEAGLIIPTLVGNDAIIRKLGDDAGWDLSNVQIINAEPEGPTANAAAALASRGEVQALMKGQIHTDALMRGVLNRDAGLRTDRRVSHVFHMTVPGSDKALMITDGAVNVAPDERTMMDIVHNAVGLAHALGYEADRKSVV